MALVVAKPIQGVSVYGVQQVAYTVDGVPDQDYTQALTVASFKECAAVEAEIDVLSSMVRGRQRKLSDLGEVITILSHAQASMKSEDQLSTDLSNPLDTLPVAADLALEYYIRIPLDGDNGNQIRRDACQKAVANVKHAVDMESNSLQQDAVTLQNMIGKRDSSYQTALNLSKKSLNPSTTAIRNMKG